MTNLKKLASALAVLVVLPGASVADPDVASLPPAAADEGAKKTCEEAQRDAWFLRELKRDEGETNPELPAVPECAADEKQS
jgi:hypothetical protein